MLRFLGKVRPRFASVHLSNRDNGHTEAVGQLGRCSIGRDVRLSNQTDGFCRELRARMRCASCLQTIRVCVADILTGRHVLQVLYAIVRLVAVDVIRFIADRAGTDERRSDKDVHVRRLEMAVLPQSADHVPMSVDSQLRHPLWQTGLSAQARRDANRGRLTTHSAERTHRIQPFVADNGTPRFLSHSPEVYCAAKPTAIAA